jgi:hypothetical protein
VSKSQSCLSKLQIRVEYACVEMKKKIKSTHKRVNLTLKHDFETCKHLYLLWVDWVDKHAANLKNVQKTKSQDDT